MFGWVDGYVKSPPGRYHNALQPGDLSQTGQVQARAGCSLNKHAAGCLLAVPDCRCRWAARLHEVAGWHHNLCVALSSTVSRAHLTAAHLHLANGAHRPLPTPPRQVCELLLRSLVARRRYDPADFCSRLDALLAGLDGTPYGAGDYTDVAMRDVWRGRKVWGWGGAWRPGELAGMRGLGSDAAAGCCPPRCGLCCLAGWCILVCNSTRLACLPMPALFSSPCRQKGRSGARPGWAAGATPPKLPSAASCWQLGEVAGTQDDS